MRLFAKCGVTQWVEFTAKRYLMKHALLLVAVSLIGACAVLPKREVVTNLTIAASPQEVWAVLTDAPRYAEWNPFIVSMAGTLVEGANGSAMTFKPKLLVVRADEELRWIGRLVMPGIFDGEHYFLLREVDGETLLIHGENFSGIGLWAIDVSQFEADFVAMNEALAARVNSLRMNPKPLDSKGSVENSGM